jgi:diaminohydroxyphosphoribosylaminopyrimidine deaminase/5-amino-6-(5-phosphoribosylamino)uracil reductase
MMSSIDVHEQWMAKALQQARKGWNTTHPNPRVGCVIVRDGKLLAQGFHEFPGGPHAEINALNNLAGDAKGATVYVTLEPCSHTGKTPPCADALIAAQPDTVVIAMQDPNPLVAGRGIARLKQQGIKVISGVLKHQALALNVGFIKRMQYELPAVRIKMGMSLDGRTALANGLSQWITGAEARSDVQKLRAASSAILSSAATVIQDDASLNVRLSAEELGQAVAVRQPVRVILDSALKLSGREKLFEVNGEIWIFTTAQDEEKRNALENEQVKIFTLPANFKGRLDLRQVLHKLAELEINEVHCECGATLAGALLHEQLVDEVILYVAPDLLGNQARGLFELGEISIMSDKLSLSIEDLRMIGRDIKITAKPEITCPPLSL